jgi:hypothetical protein
MEVAWSFGSSADPRLPACLEDVALSQMRVDRNAWADSASEHLQLRFPCRRDRQKNPRQYLPATTPGTGKYESWLYSPGHRSGGPPRVRSASSSSPVPEASAGPETGPSRRQAHAPMLSRRPQLLLVADRHGRATARRRTPHDRAFQRVRSSVRVVDYARRCPHRRAEFR